MQEKPNLNNQDNLQTLSRKILNLANKDISQYDFLQEITSLLANFSEFSVVELLFRANNKYQQFIFSKTTPSGYHILKSKQLDKTILPILTDSPFDDLKIDIIQKASDQNSKKTIFQKSIFIENLMNLDSGSSFANLSSDPHLKKHRSIILVPLLYGNESIGLLQLLGDKQKRILDPNVELFEDIARILGIALINQSVQAALRERVKELSCVYNIARIAEEHNNSQKETLEKILALIPSAWQYPDITEGRIVLDSDVYTTSGFVDKHLKQVAMITVNGEPRGHVEVVYMKNRPTLFEGPFLEEERKLIDTIAKQIALIIERRESEKNKIELQEQLRHADRLATIGQLAAGVAHELNEPLGNILGFAQLISKSGSMSEQEKRDIDKIIYASLSAREIIKKLMLFARQLPANKTNVNLNKVIEEGVYFFEARCLKAGIDLKTKMAFDLPYITGDAAQLNQVLVNLMVNSIQAMPKGGKLTISTLNSPDYVSLIVEDSGHGMADEVLNKIFIPFFTTKEINEGTGLGLAVVHGIISSHKGKIKVESIIDKGTRFEVRFPLPSQVSEEDNTS